jgi:hypothetical protein
MPATIPPECGPTLRTIACHPQDRAQNGPESGIPPGVCCVCLPASARPHSSSLSCNPHNFRAHRAGDVRTNRLAGAPWLAWASGRIEAAARAASAQARSKPQHVDPERFEKRVSLTLFERVTDTMEEERGKTAFTVVYDKLRLNAYIHSSQPVPNKVGRLTIRIDSGLRAATCASR